MNALIAELKNVVTKQIEIATPGELAHFIGALAGNDRVVTEDPLAVRPALGLEDRFTKIGAAGQRLPFSAQEWAAVHDAETDLYWTRSPVGGKRHSNWKAAMDAASAVTLFGLKWKAPTRKQQLSIVDDERHAPAVNADYFTVDTSDWYWTSSPAANSPEGCAWFVGLHGGGAYWGSRRSSGFVLAVAPSQ